MTFRHFLTATAAVLFATTLATQAQDKAAPDKKGGPAGMGMLQKDRPKNAKTEITCKDEATFDNESGIATFVTGVFVKDPQFNLYCDKLTVYLNKDRKGIDRAEASGKVVIVQENKNDKGGVDKSIGRGERAVFTPATGKAVLTGMPQLQQGINNHIATSPETVMTLMRDGQLQTEGPSRTSIVEAPAE
jgi:lipopolysaccharide transport protein LptA